MLAIFKEEKKLPIGAIQKRFWYHNASKRHRSAYKNTKGKIFMYGAPD